MVSNLDSTEYHQLYHVSCWFLPIFNEPTRTSEAKKDFEIQGLMDVIEP